MFLLSCKGSAIFLQKYTWHRFSLVLTLLNLHVCTVYGQKDIPAMRHMFTSLCFIIDLYRLWLRLVFERIYAKSKNIKEKFDPTPESANRTTTAPCLDSLILGGWLSAARFHRCDLRSWIYLQIELLTLWCQCNRMYLVTFVLSLLCPHSFFYVLVLR